MTAVGGVCDICNFKANKVKGVKNHIARKHKKDKVSVTKPKEPTVLVSQSSTTLHMEQTCRIVAARKETGPR